MKVSTDNNLPEQKRKSSNPMMRNEYPDADEDPNEDDCLMPRADSRRAVQFEMCDADQDAQERERNPDETLKTKMRRKLLSFVCPV